MGQVTRQRPRLHLPRLALNADGERHPLLDGLAVFTLVAGAIACPVGFIVSQHVLASWAGAAGLVVGMYAQLISVTRAQRMLIVTGLVASFVGVALGMAHGGFLP